MKNLSLVLLMTIVACTPSSENKSGIVQDTTGTADIVAHVADTAHETVQPPLDYMMAPGDSSAAGQLFTSLKDSIDDIKDTFLEVSISSNQYEASAETTWYFDAEIKPVYYYQRWSSEGSEGSTERFINDNMLVCVSIWENSTSETWCEATGGIRVQPNESEGDDIVTALDAAYGTAVNESFRRDLDLISSFFREAEIVDETEEWITLRIEEVFNPGEQEYVESTEMRIHRKVYDEFK